MRSWYASQYLCFILVALLFKIDCTMLKVQVWESKRNKFLFDGKNYGRAPCASDKYYHLYTGRALREALSSLSLIRFLICTDHENCICRTSMVEIVLHLILQMKRLEEVNLQFLTTSYYLLSNLSSYNISSFRASKMPTEEIGNQVLLMARFQTFILLQR